MPRTPASEPAMPLPAAVPRAASPLPADAAVLDEQAARIGARIRARRREQDLTLVRLAAATGLSHPFLSQLERGRARPSMVSLERIARALGTSQIELMAAAQEEPSAGDPNRPTVLRADEGVVGPYAGGTARLLVHGHRVFHPLEFAGANTDPGDHYVHDEDEFVYVVAGRIVMDLGDEGVHELAAGDSVYYSGGTRHRWSSPDGEPYRLFLVKQRSAASGRDPDGDRVFAAAFPGAGGPVDGEPVGVELPGRGIPVAGDAGYEVVVRDRRPAADAIDVWELGFADGRDLPAWRPGAHLDLLVPGEAADGSADVLERRYSLCGDPADRGTWRIGVLREPGGRGGSERIHTSVQIGTTLRVRGPRNRFPLDPAPAYAFVAAGIGITPIVPMIRAADAAGAEWTLDYAGRSRSTMAFADDLVAAHGARVRLHPADEGPRLDLAAVLAARPAGAPVYTCGPARLIDALEQLTATDPPGTLRTERFEARELGDPVLREPFEVELAMTGTTVSVPLGRTILDVAEEAGALVVASCREGTCGTCETPVLEGSVEHRDSVLTPEEQADDRVMMICVSRSRGPRLVLDL